MPQVLLNTDFRGLRLFKRGKVRDVYECSDKLLIVSTDRISCFDVVLPCGIPYKGKVLNQLSAFWFIFLKEIIPNHLITTDVGMFPEETHEFSSSLAGRSMLAVRASSLPVECVVRGYLAGSGWKEYRQTGKICGVKLPPGLKESDKLPEPIFTPSTKEDTGHDVNVSLEYVEDQIGSRSAARLKEISIAIYNKASAYAQGKGIIIADTKFEFGIYNDKLMLIDEALTPDSSRFWPMDQYCPGKAIPSFDKQYVRDYLETLSWAKSPPAPDLDPGVIEKTSQKYLQAYRTLAGQELSEG